MAFDEGLVDGGGNAWTVAAGLQDLLGERHLNVA